MSRPTRSTVTADELAGIRATSDRFAQFMINREFDALSQLYTSDAVLMPPHHPVVEGREQIRAFLDSFPKVSRFSIGIDEVDGALDIIYVRGTYEMTAHPDGAPEPVDDVGKYLEIRRRQPDGSFLFSVDMFSSDNE